MPSIRPSLIVVLTTISITTLKVFDIVRTMTGGNFDTSVLAYEFYAQSFRSFDQGLGAALAVLIFVLVMPIVDLQRPSDAQAGGTMTTATRHDLSVDGTSPPQETGVARSAAQGAHARRGPRCAAVVIAMLWTIPTLGLFITSFRPESDITHQRLVDVLHQPAASRWTTTTQVLHGSDTQPLDVLRELDRDHASRR